jgi:hypothetical protein
MKMSDEGVAIDAVRERFYRLLFLSAAAWNVLSAAAVLFLLTSSRVRSEMGYPGQVDTISLQLLATCLFVFGVGYYWVSRDLTRNRDLVKLGVIGKPFVFLVFLGHALTKEIPASLVAPSVVDLLFGMLFLEFLVRTRGKAQ